MYCLLEHEEAVPDQATPIIARCIIIIDLQYLIKVLQCQFQLLAPNLFPYSTFGSRFYLTMQFLFPLNQYI